MDPNRIQLCVKTKGILELTLNVYIRKTRVRWEEETAVTTQYFTLYLYMEPATVLGVGINSPLFLTPPDSKPPLSTSPELASTSPTLTPSSTSNTITVLSSLSCQISLLTTRSYSWDIASAEEVSLKLYASSQTKSPWSFTSRLTWFNPDPPLLLMTQPWATLSRTYIAVFLIGNNFLWICYKDGCGRRRHMGVHIRWRRW